MENNFYRKVNIVEDWIPRFTPAIDWDNITPGKNRPPFERHFTNIDEVVPSNIVERLKDVGLTIRSARIFSWPRAQPCVWHIDGKAYTHNTAMNFVLFGSGKIQWASNVNVRKNNPYGDVWAGIKGSPDQEIIEETDIKVGIFKISVPHRIVTGPEGRITLSLLWQQKCNYEFPEMVARLTDAGFIDKE